MSASRPGLRNRRSGGGRTTRAVSSTSSPRIARRKVTGENTVAPKSRNKVSSSKATPKAKNKTTTKSMGRSSGSKPKTRKDISEMVSAVLSKASQSARAEAPKSKASTKAKKSDKAKTPAVAVKKQTRPDKAKAKSSALGVKKQNQRVAAAMKTKLAKKASELAAQVSKITPKSAVAKTVEAKAKSPSKRQSSPVALEAAKKTAERIRKASAAKSKRATVTAAGTIPARSSKKTNTKQRISTAQGVMAKAKSLISQIKAVKKVEVPAPAPAPKTSKPKKLPKATPTKAQLALWAKGNARERAAEVSRLLQAVDDIFTPEPTSKTKAKEEVEDRPSEEVTTKDVVEALLDVKADTRGNTRPVARRGRPPGSTKKPKVVEPPPPPEVKKPEVVRFAAGERRNMKRRAAAASNALSGGTSKEPSAGSSTNGVNGVHHHAEHHGASASSASLADRKLSVAERQRAAAEEAFSRIAPALSVQAPTPPPEETPVQHRGGPPQFHRSEFQIRFSESDSLATKVRTAEDEDDAYDAACDLAERFGLPPDQQLLTRVLTFGDDRLTQLALEEFLDLDDRGRVRSNPELVEILKAVRTRDRDVRELIDLFLAKLGQGAAAD